MPARLVKKEELRVFLMPKQVKDIDGDIGARGTTRSEVVRSIVQKHYDERRTQ